MATTETLVPNVLITTSGILVPGGDADTFTRTQ
jgi:hypothetical protein